MRVTNLNYWMEDALIKKLDLMIERCSSNHPKKDAVLIISGNEGDGKTTMSANCGYYIKSKTKREFTNKNMFYSAEAMMKFAQSTEKQIIIYDEPALDMLSNEWWKREQRNLIKLLMICRSKQHFIIFNITKFNKFPEYIVVDRALGMIHVYARHEIQMGRFVYIRKKNLEKLYNDWRIKRIRNYKKYTHFRGSFPDMLDKIIDIKTYEKEKNKAILSIGVVDKKRDINQEKLIEIRKKIGNLKFPIQTKKELSIQFGLSTRTFERWKVIDRKEQKITPPSTFDTPKTTNML